MYISQLKMDQRDRIIKANSFFLKVECLVLKNHNCFVLYLNCNPLFSRKNFFKKCYIFLKNSWKLKSKNFLWIFFHVSQVVRIKCTRLRLGLFYVFLECTTYNLIFTIFFFHSSSWVFLLRWNNLKFFVFVRFLQS